MSVPIVTSLLLKKADIEAQIAGVSERLALARADHATVVATVRLFDPYFVDRSALAYHGTTRSMKLSTAIALCRATLRTSPVPLDTRELAAHIITVEEWDGDDARLRLAMTARVGAIMHRIAMHGAVEKVGTNRNAALWVLKDNVSGRKARPDHV